MAYVGNTPTTQNFISGTDYFNGTGSQTAFTLSRTVNSVNDIQVTVNNVVQQPNDAYTLSGTTLTMTSAPSAGTNNVYVRYLSTTTQAITPSQNTVSWNTLDSNIQQDLGVMYKNRIINGNMAIDQRNAGAASPSTTGFYFGVDRFQTVATGGGAITMQQSSTAPTGFRNSLSATVLTADSSIAAGDEYAIYQPIEGFNVADIGFGTANAQNITLSFWVRSSITGTYSGALYTSSRAYIFTYSISSANTFEYKTVSLTADTSGSYNTTNGVGIIVGFDLGSGSNFNGTANTWQNGSYLHRTSGSVNWIANAGATFYITGVQLEVGTQATAFSTAGGSYGAEFALCQRYCWVTNSDSLTIFIGAGTTSSWGNVVFPVAMRAAPTPTLTGTLCISDQVAFDATAASPTVANNNLGTFGGRFQIAGWNASLTAYRPYTGTAAGGSGKVTFSAEL